jgi:hypothetical protein
MLPISLMGFPECPRQELIVANVRPVNQTHPMALLGEDETGRRMAMGRLYPRRGTKWRPIAKLPDFTLAPHCNNCCDALAGG